MRPAIDPDVIYSVREAAELMKVSRNTVAAWLARGELKGAKFGTRSWRIKGSALLDLYERRAAERGKATEPVQVEMLNRSIYDDDDEETD